MLAAYRDENGYVGEPDPEGPALVVKPAPLPAYITRDMHMRATAPQMLAALREIRELLQVSSDDPDGVRWLAGALCNDDYWQVAAALQSVESAIAQAERVA